jgi:hypothetical protein
MPDAVGRPDRLRLNDEGYARMGWAIDLALFGCRGKRAPRYLRSESETQLILAAKYIFTYEGNC